MYQHIMPMDMYNLKCTVKKINFTLKSLVYMIKYWTCASLVGRMCLQKTNQVTFEIGKENLCKSLDTITIISTQEA